MIKLLLSLLLLSSCGSLPVAYLDTPLIVYRTAFGYPYESVTQEYFEDFKYSFARVRFGKGQSFTIVLASVEDGIYTWVSNDGVKIFTEDGRIIKTIGLINDFEIISSFNITNAKKGLFYELINFEDPLLLNSVLVVERVPTKQIELTLAEQTKKVEVIEEQISIDKIGWAATNTYYVDEKNNILKATQHVHPFLNRIEIEFYIK